jgi:hypothetical protein
MVGVVRLVLVNTEIVEASYLGGILRSEKKSRDFSYRVQVLGGCSGVQLITADRAPAEVTPDELSALIGKTTKTVNVQIDRRRQLNLDDGRVLEVSGARCHWILIERDATSATHGELLSRCEVEGRLAYASEFQGAPQDFQWNPDLGWDG